MAESCSVLDVWLVAHFFILTNSQTKRTHLAGVVEAREAPHRAQGLLLPEERAHLVRVRVRVRVRDKVGARVRVRVRGQG